MAPRASGTDSAGTNGKWAIKKVIEIPAEPADPEKLPPILQGFKAVAPLVTDINLSIDDRYLYVSCWGTGEFIQYDVRDPFKPKKVSSIRLGGIVRRTAHPSKPGQMLNGGPQMVEISRDGKRIYFTNGLYTPWDDQFYPDGVRVMEWNAMLVLGASPAASTTTPTATACPSAMGGNARNTPRTLPCCIPNATATWSQEIPACPGPMRWRLASIRWRIYS